jgi:UDP-3-O-[3-hydroxymyristoyl] glucosamine N-acyltransferase
MLELIKSLLVGGAAKTTAGELAEKFGLELRGDAKTIVNGVAPIAEARPGQLAFYSTERNSDAFKILPIEVLKKTRASVILVQPENVKFAPKSATLLITDSPRGQIVKMLGELYRGKIPNKIARTAKIHRGAFIGDNVIIGENTVVHAGAHIENATVGADCVIHAGAVVGKDGFGYTRQDGKNIFIPHVGRVILGDRVSIGANTCIDRGLITDTTIGDGTKIDNLVQIAHGVVVGRECFIAAAVGLAGGVVVGDRVLIGGQVGIANKVKIGDDAEIGAHSGVMRDVPAGQKYMGYPAVPGMEFMRMHAWLRKAIKVTSNQ